MSTYHTYSAIDIAYMLLEKAAIQGKQLTNLHLQKLVYVCHGLSLAHFDRPLILEDVHAWKFGPVIPSVYFKFKKYGSDVIDESKQVNLDSDSADITEGVISMLGDLSAIQLVELTHREGSPWQKTWQHKNMQIIPDSLIKDHYLKIKETGLTNCL